MIKKKVLLFGDLGKLGDFFNSGYNREYDPVAIVIKPTNILYNIPKGNFPKIDVVAPEKLPDFIYKMVDGVILIDRENMQTNINYLLKRGVEARNIIIWDDLGNIKMLSDNKSDGLPAVMIEGLEFHLRNNDDKIFFDNIKTRLQNQKHFFAFDPRGYANLLARNYFAIMKSPLKWNNLQTWTEKIQWLKLFDASPLKSRLTDKYLVRYWVSDKIGDEYLTPLYGCWNNFDDIDFNFLPEKFVLKCNHAPNFSVVVDKNNIDVRNLREKFKAMMQVDYSAQFTFELHYGAIKRRIIAEKFIEGNAAEYKFLCFNGKPIYCRHAGIYFDMNFKVADFEESKKIHKSKNFKLMRKLAEKLCDNFAFVRVDFKEIDDEIYFDALEFTPAAGMIKFKSDAVDKKFGELLTLPNTPARLPRYNPDDYMLLADKYEFKFHFAHPERITFPNVEPCNGRVIASLTSWVKRISTVHLAVQTILAQSHQPDLTVLYLADSEFPNREKDLPPQLTALLSDKFAIHWTKDIKSYKKLIPALKEFPDDIIITFDDDLLYHKETISRLLTGYKKYPGCVQCHVGDGHYISEIVSSSTIYNFPNEYMHLNVAFGVSYDYPTYLSAFNGSKTVLYPPHALHKDVFDEDRIMTLAPRDDDILLPLMAVLNGYRIHAIDNRINNENYIPQTQGVGITGGTTPSENYRMFGTAYKNIFNAYPQLRDIIIQEWINAKP